MSCSSCSWLVGRELGEQVCGIVGLHRLEDVGGALGVEAGKDLHLVVLGQLLKDVGEPVVVELCGDRGSSAAELSSWIMSARSATRRSS